ncbi:unnamed protein product [Brassicogethes aeneus]|uniref:Uncharacterized protein n=1 Tax=Brassicogethes aeneus TaxID=1431903 RepID=A0A9P0FMA9_BRAAE|nr:unnamed protein product [Brassicogethes aeneus]
MKGRKDMKQSFSCQGLVFVHWDGKILPDYHYLTKVEHLSVVVSADGIEKLLGVQQMKSETYFENGIWWIKESSQRSLDGKLQDLENTILDITKCPPEKIDELQRTIKAFKVVYKRRWLACNYIEARFLEKYEEWLNEEIEIPTDSIPGSSKGRPSKEFGESSDRSKRRKTMELRYIGTVDELTYAAQMTQRAAGNIDVAKVIQDVTKSPTRATKFRKAAIIGSKTMTTKKHTPEGALGIFVEANLTVSQYKVIRQANKDVYPCYTYVQRAKQDCYPPKNVSETVAEVKLQDLVDHTTSRLCKYLEPVFQQSIQSTDTDLVLIYKWGCDGSTQTQYKQKFEEDGNSDANIFLSSIVPLRLMSGNKIIWQNMQPSSPRYCRPIRIRYVKEDKDITNEEIEYIENQALNLQATRVCNAATNTSSTLRCYICGKTSKSFNELTSTNPENPETFKFGLSILHARIRFFEFLLHLSYKIKAEVYKGRIKEKSDRGKIQAAKETVQKEFHDRMGLLVDIPKAGYGNTNDGNSSRRFFNNPQEAADITGVDLILIIYFKVILEVISSGFDIDLKKFSTFTMNTANHYVNLYPWQPMSPTVHKILMPSSVQCHSPCITANRPIVRRSSGS